MSNFNPVDNLAHLSDADINTLYEIVVLAGEKSGPPFGPGLFAAYDEVVSRYEPTDEERKRYFDFIIHMGSDRRTDESALDRFARMLADADIAITPINTLDSEEGQEIGTQVQEQGNPRLHSSLEARDGQHAVLSQAKTLAGDDEATRLPYGPRSNLKSGTHGASRGRRGTLGARRARSEDTQGCIMDNLRGRLKLHNAPEEPLRTRNRRTVSVSSNRSVQLRGPYDFVYGNGYAYSADESEGSNPRTSIRQALPNAASMVRDARQFLPPELYQRSQEQLEDDADSFQQTKAKVAQRRLFWEWRRKVAEIYTQREQLDILAENFDRGKLLRDSFVIWRVKLDNKRLTKASEDNESFYQTIEDSAVKERERNLKWVAFTHWEQSAKDERQRTSLARRHILRKKYFDAWTQVTAVNDLKVRRFILKKFLAIWEQRLDNVVRLEVQATAVQDNNVIGRTYKKWAMVFMDKVAPQWHSKRRLRHYFHRWKVIVQHIRDRDRQVMQMRRKNVQRRMLAMWNAKRQTLQHLYTMAGTFRRHKLLAQSIDVLRREAVHIPRADQLTKRIDQRVLRHWLSIWSRNVRLSLQAARVRNLCIMRDAFSMWNERLRTRFLEGLVHQRLRAEAFYQWTITTRGKVAARQYDRKIAVTCLEHWISKAQNRQRSIEGAEQTLRTSQRHRTLHGTLTKLCTALQKYQHLEKQAQEFRNTRLLSNAFLRWMQQNSHAQQLVAKADAANFYILATKSLKLWSQASQERRRLRKRDAYFQIRRLCKMNLARESLRRWQMQLAQGRHMDHSSLEFQEDLIIKHTTSALQSWKDKLVKHLERERQAKEVYNRKLLTVTLNKLVQKKEQLQQMSAHAKEFAMGGQAVELMICFKKMDRRLFQLKGQEQWALALRDKHWEKHVKNMLRYWLEQAMTARRQSGAHGAAAGEDLGFARVSNVVPEIGDLSVFETTTWNFGPLDLDLNPFSHQDQLAGQPTFLENEGIITSTPLPGYLRTPSKRNTARAKARERLASNLPTTTSLATRMTEQQFPATAPPRQQASHAPRDVGKVITPFERRLREQGYSSPSRFGRSTSGPRPSRFGAARGAKSQAQVGTIGFAGFEDIAEVSEEKTRES